MKVPQSNLRESPSNLKDNFSTIIGPYIFTLTAPELFEQSNETSGILPILKSTSHFLHQSKLSCKSDSSSEGNSSPKSEVHL